VTARAASLARRSEPIRAAEEPPIRLLIVDDSSVARAVLSRMLSPQPGLEVVGAASCVADALALLRASGVDIVLLDIEMPGGSGLEGLPAIIEAGRGARVLIVSSFAEHGAEAAVRALSLGATDTMPKPGSGMFGGQFAQLWRTGCAASAASVPSGAAARGFPRASCRCARSRIGSRPASPSARPPAASTRSTNSSAGSRPAPAFRSS
jgi:two-component system chemotaxis response regulator CheB